MIRTQSLMLVVTLAVGFGSARGWAEDQAELTRMKQALFELQKRIQELEDKQKKEAEDKAKAADAQKAGPTVKYSGYLQGEVRRRTGEGVNVTEEDVRRARFKVDAKLPGKAGVTLQLDLARNVELRDAYGDLVLGTTKLRLGQFKVPLSSQILESSTVRLAPERALINLRTVPGERDRGLLLEWQLDKEAKVPPVLQVGVFNGRGANQSEADTDKDLFAALSLSGKPWSGRVGYLEGKYQNFAADGTRTTRVTKSRWSADVTYDQAPWNLQLQYGQGKGDFPRAGGTVSAADVSGAYVQVGYRLPDLPLTTVARYQTYDPNTDTPNNKISGPLLGLVYEADKAILYTLAWEKLNNQAVAGSLNQFTLRGQVKY